MRSVTRILVLVFLYVVISRTNTAGIPFIIDTDVDIDDTLAFMYMLQNKQFDVKAITTVGNAFTRADKGIEIVTRLLTLLNMSAGSVPIVAKGETKAISQVGVTNYGTLPNDFIVGSESLYGLLNTLPEARVNASSKPAIDVIYEIASSNSGKLSILAIGTMTNIAVALKKYPDLRNKIERIYVMGGAVYAKGNLLVEVNGTFIRSQNTFAEFNIYLDPEAAQQVFSSGIPIVLVPLDATNYVPMNDQFYQSLTQVYNSTIKSQYTYNILTKLKVDFNFVDWYFWDTVTSVIAGHSVHSTIARVPITVVTDSSIQSGRTKFDAERGSMIDVCVSLLRNTFEDAFLHAITTRF